MRSKQYRYSTEQIAKESGVPVWTVRRLIREGKLKVEEFGKVCRWVVSKQLEKEAAREQSEESVRG